MRLTSLLAFTITLAGPLAFATIGAAETDLSARAIMEKEWWAGRIKGMESLSTMTIYNESGQKRVRETASVSKLYDNGHTNKRLIRFLKPADVKGTGLLTFDYETKDDDIWFFLPSMRKTRRIVSSEKSKSFMGSEFTYADIAPAPLDNFAYKRLRQEQADGVDCWVIEIVSKSEAVAEENGFSKKVVWVGQEDFTTRKVLYYDQQDKLLREMEATEVTLIDKEEHRFLARRKTMVNKQNGRKSTLEITKYKLTKDLPDKYLSIRYLERF